MMLVVWFQAPLQLRLNIFSVLLFLSAHQMPALPQTSFHHKEKNGAYFYRNDLNIFPTALFF